MDIEFDYKKDQINQRDKGISLSEAIHLEWDQMVSFVDNRKDYGEERVVGYAPIDTRLYCVVYTQREDCIRVISLRKANKREIRLYEQETNTPFE